MSKFTLGTNTARNLETLLQSGNDKSLTLLRLVRDFINYTPADFCIIPDGGFRTYEQQKEKFDRGASKCDGKIKISSHQYGQAVDLVPWIDGKPQWNRDSALYISGAFVVFCRIRGVDVTSGADWNGDGLLKGDSWDPCHIQIK